MAVPDRNARVFYSAQPKLGHVAGSPNIQLSLVDLKAEGDILSIQIIDSSKVDEGCIKRSVFRLPRVRVEPAVMVATDDYLVLMGLRYEPINLLLDVLSGTTVGHVASVDE